MPKETRPLGKDRPNQTKVFQGVAATDDFPSPNLNVSLDDILHAQEEKEMRAQPPASTSIAPAPSSTAEFREVPVDLIDTSPYQPRLGLTDEEQERLTTSIAVAGRVNRPLLLRPKEGGRFELIGGATRLRSAVSLGWATVPARIVDVDDAEAEILAVSDNEGHKDLTDFEKGRSYTRILSTGKIRSYRALSARLGSSPATITRCLAFMKLPNDCIAYLEENPATLGGKLVTEFVDLSAKHPELTLESLIKIDQEGLSQEAALRWLTSAAAAASGTVKSQIKEVTNLQLAGGASATMTRRKDTISVKLPKGFDMDAIQDAIRAAIQALPGSK